ncbi:hypothetical protein O6H91_20G070900 [Diphasiastrum complanatum]|uniref:Uncharacterized protein n=1 Tax=Diphasiastrum complanatum TaxID=34168 RepID=A0ACC2AT35_DIPCM|nr:hypothetical protein O6H91_20G070900 [Diphasiastrum complanatum]
MESLTLLAESMQQAAAVLSEDDGEEQSKQYSTFLNVVPLGTVGAGKSAILNSLIGHPVLPTGENGATRAPIVIELEHVGSDSKGLLSVQVEGGKSLQVSASEIRHSLQKRLSKIASSSSASQPEEIFLKLRSSAAPPLKLIDLPGLDPRVPLDDSVVNAYAGNNDALLLLVIPAISVRDIAGSPALKLAQDLDPDGTRTIGVVSKVDQAASDQRSLAAVQALLLGQGPSITSQIPWAALIGQSVSIAVANSGSVSGEDSLEMAWKAEAESLKSILAGAPSTKLGRLCLVDSISQHIRQRIKQRLPNLLSGLEGRSQVIEEELVRLGEQMVETEEGTCALALELCREFEDKFLQHLQTGEVVLEADGYQPYLISPEKGLRELVRRALELAKDPGKSCVDEVHRVLLDIVSSAASSTPGLGRYPPFKREIVAIATGTLDDYRAEAKKLVVGLVDMERAFIPAQHFSRLVQHRLERLRREDEQRTRASKKAQDAEQALLNKTSTPQGNLTSGKSGGSLKSLKGQAAQTDKDDKENPSSQNAVAVGEISGVYLWKKSLKKPGWIKRWFVLNEKTNRLGYTKTPEERHYRGVINLEECFIEDAPDKDDDDDTPTTTKSSKGSKRSSGKESSTALSQSLAFKISNKVPYKTVIKAHSSILFKADSLAEKQEWMTKLQNCAQPSKSSSAKGSSDGNSQPPDNNSLQMRGSVPESASETILRRPIDPEEDLKLMAQEVRDYVEAVLNSLSANIPKAIVLSQIERAKDAMLNNLYSSISKHPTSTIQELLQEDPEVKRRRERYRKQASMLSRLTRQLSSREARVSTANGFSDAGSPGSSGNEDWRVAFEEAANTTSNSYENLTSTIESPWSSTNGRSDRRNNEPDENGSIGPGRRTPTRRPPQPPAGSAPVYRY